MKHETEVTRWLGQREGVLLLVLAGVCAVLFLVGAGDGFGPRSGFAPGGAAATAVALTDGVFAGAILSLAAFLTYLNWRRSPDPRVGWVVAAGVLISCQSLSLAGLAVYDNAREAPQSSWPLYVVAGTTLVALVLALLGLRRGTRTATDPLSVGLVLGLIAAGCLLLPVSASFPAPTWALLTVIAASHVGLAASVVCNTALSRSTAALLVVTIVIISTRSLVIPAGLSGTIWEATISLALAVTGGAWLMSTFANLHSDAEEGQRHSADLEDSLLATVGSDRDSREQLHELRSTLAGLINASQLLERSDIATDVRLRLEDITRRELTRMHRLVSDEKDLPTAIDLDEALDVILDAQRLKGRRIDFEPSGDTVQGRYDALAGIVGILVDNAATHGGCDDSVVAVTRRDDETVEISVTDRGRGIPADERERVFGWGEQGEDSKGQGIGLNLARRLASEGGGTLTCEEPVGGGSSFVISLPAARRSPENDCVSDPR